VGKKLTVNWLTMIHERILLKLAFALNLIRVEPAAETKKTVKMACLGSHGL
jgi:hypothetical protein